MQLVVFLYAKKAVLKLCFKIAVQARFLPTFVRGYQTCSQENFVNEQQLRSSLLGVRPRVPNLQSHSQEEREAEAGKAEGAGTDGDDFEAVVGCARSSDSDALAAAFAFF